MTPNPATDARCKAEQQCPARMACRRFLDHSGPPETLRFAAWEARRAGAPRCDGFLPATTTTQEAS